MAARDPLHSWQPATRCTRGSPRPAARVAASKPRHSWWPAPRCTRGNPRPAALVAARNPLHSWQPATRCTRGSLSALKKTTRMPGGGCNGRNGRCSSQTALARPANGLPLAGRALRTGKILRLLQANRPKEVLASTKGRPQPLRQPWPESPAQNPRRYETGSSSCPGASEKGLSSAPTLSGAAACGEAARQAARVGLRHSARQPAARPAETPPEAQHTLPRGRRPRP